MTSSKSTILQNLDILQTQLAICTQNGMEDTGSALYNVLLSLIEETHLVQTTDELQEVVTQAKTIEMDIDSWLSRKGLTTMSLSWPK